MGKEAKIGLGIILVLLIVLGVVLARRLSGPPEEASTAAPAANASPATNKQDDATGKETADRSPFTRPGARPTVVEAKVGTDRSGRHSFPSDVGRWGTGSDKSAPRQAAGEVEVTAPPPSFQRIYQSHRSRNKRRPAEAAPDQRSQGRRKSAPDARSVRGANTHTPPADATYTCHGPLGAAPLRWRCFDTTAAGPD